MAATDAAADGETASATGCRWPVAWSTSANGTAAACTPHQFEGMVAEVSNGSRPSPRRGARPGVARGNIHMLGTWVRHNAAASISGCRATMPASTATWLSGTEVAALVATLAAMDYEARGRQSLPLREARRPGAGRLRI